MKTKTNLTVSVGLILLGIAILILWGCVNTRDMKITVKKEKEKEQSLVYGNVLIVTDERGGYLFTAVMDNKSNVAKISDPKLQILIGVSGRAFTIYLKQQGWHIKSTITRKGV